MDYINNMLMNLPFTLPPWMPGWLILLLALPVLLYVLAFLLMPFSVFGVKARIEALEAQIDSLHEELRMMAMRAAGVLPPTAARLEPFEEHANFGRFKKSQREAAQPEFEPEPAPPPARQVTLSAPIRDRFAPTPQAPPPRPARRTEPRLD